jgi:hypothetical protein
MLSYNKNILMHNTHKTGMLTESKQGLYYVLCLASSETDLRCSYIRFSVVALVFACGPEVAEISSLATLYYFYVHRVPIV